MECSRNITGPIGTRLILVFYRICLGICTTGMYCQCDNLVIKDAVNLKQLCIGDGVPPFFSMENKISLTMVSDDQHTSKGFVAEYHSVRLDTACSQMIQLTNMSGWFSSPNFPSNYPSNTQCGWNISIPTDYQLYLTFLEFDLEECGSSCTCDYVEVTYSKEYSVKRCGAIFSRGWKVKSVLSDNIVVTFKSDGASNKKGFEAIYTLERRDRFLQKLEARLIEVKPENILTGREYREHAGAIPPVYCPWTQSATTEPISDKDGISTDSIETAIAQTARPDVMTSAVSTAQGSPSASTDHTKNTTEKRRSSWLLILVIIFALILLSHFPE